MKQKGLWAKAVALAAATGLALTIGTVTVTGARAAQPAESAESGTAAAFATTGNIESSVALSTVTIGNTQVDAAFGITTSQELEALLLSDIPADVVLDAQSGEIDAVHVSTNHETGRAGMARGVTCTPQSVCLRGNWQVSFNVAGTYSGNWKSIQSWSTGKWTAQIKWKHNGSTHTSAKLGAKKNTAIAGGALVTVIWVRLW